jgi:UDP-N-acetylglucosamine--N-acetylmuramyl-(pentapeptide) pyrophosphoryl-undecaprenol N-acetylglucosamine transferase
VAELAAAGVPAILVPFPFAVDDHQTTNARYLTDAGAAILVQQRDLTPEKLAAVLRGWTRPDLAAMAEKARALGRPEAARAVAEACVDLAK